MSTNFSIKTKLVNSKEYLFDELRKKWILSTPEEEYDSNFGNIYILKKNILLV